ncbi:Cytochrome P450 [Vigna angularis]|uniref:Cytochrome P450 n=1 Tax=Phaseolus angularis TaxID=3914 RepID=A0A8T0JPS8_PHAAN|nr:Cytochrome P450 [Vigna angularis]
MALLSWMLAVKLNSRRGGYLFTVVSCDDGEVYVSSDGGRRVPLLYEFEILVIAMKEAHRDLFSVKKMNVEANITESLLGFLLWGCYRFHKNSYRMPLNVSIANSPEPLVVGDSITPTELLKWNSLRYSRKGMPPGSLGWPFVGETIKFLTQGPDFMKRGTLSQVVSFAFRHGSLFKTHVLGSPTVISTDPEINRYILMNEAKGLVPGYPDSMRKILGTNISEVHGAEHKRIRGSLLSLVGPIAVKDRLLTEVDDFMSSYLDNWDAVVEDEPNSFIEYFKASFDKMALGTISLPFKIPGTQYYRGLKAREKVLAMLRELIAKRRASSATHNDILDQLVRNEDGKYKLNDEEIMEQITTILYSGYETVSTTTMMSIKYLCDNPDILQADEHFAILQKKLHGERINWDDYKSMRQTRAVLLETMRLASVVNGVMRRTTKDIELNGYMIPKGWRVYVYTRDGNFDPILYEEPFTFNPRRWLEKGLETHNHNMLFGAGGRVCPGKEWGMFKINGKKLREAKHLRNFQEWWHQQDYT